VALDPANSLRARMIAADAASDTARTARVTGRGHAFWADAGTGVSHADQAALIAYLHLVDRLTEPVTPPLTRTQPTRDPP
jgi:hypothetical protein